jgi:hypothetical protein
MIRNIVSFLPRIALCLGYLCFPAVAQQANNPSEFNRAEGSDFSVVVTTVKEVRLVQQSVGTTVYEISYEYDFKRRDSIYIMGVGVVKPKGRFKYHTPTLELEFRSAEAGELLARVPLKVTVTTAGSPLDDAPAESEFPQDFLTGTWTSGNTFPEKAMAVLQRRSSIRAMVIDNVNVYLTRYTSLTSASGRTAQIAVLVSHPFSQATGRFTFHVRYLGREKRALTEWRALGDDLKQRAEQFIRDLITEIQAASNAGSGAQTSSTQTARSHSRRRRSR